MITVDSIDVCKCPIIIATQSTSLFILKLINYSNNCYSLRLAFLSIPKGNWTRIRAPQLKISLPSMQPLEARNILINLSIPTKTFRKDTYSDINNRSANINTRSRARARARARAKVKALESPSSMDVLG